MIEAVIVSTARTGLGKSWKGAFNMTYGATLGAHAVRHAVARAGVDAAEVEDVIMGSAFGEGTTGGNIARAIALRAGLPVTTAGMSSAATCPPSADCAAAAPRCRQPWRSGCCNGASLTARAMDFPKPWRPRTSTRPIGPNSSVWAYRSMVSIRGSWIPLPAVSSRSTRSARSSLTARSCSSAIGTGRRRAHRRSSRSTANASCARAIIDWCRDNMAAFKVPRIVEFVAELPKSGSGKIQWRELQERERMRKSS